MGLLITLFLIIVNTYGNVLESSPPNRGFGLIELWMMGAQFPVFFAMLQYGYILFQIKRDHGPNCPVRANLSRTQSKLQLKGPQGSPKTMWIQKLKMKTKWTCLQETAVVQTKDSEESTKTQSFSPFLALLSLTYSTGHMCLVL